MASKIKYRWNKLPGPRSFRLLQLLGHDDGGSIVFSLQPEEIDASPNFAAISYSWGNSERTHEARCDRKLVPVTAGVHALFTHLLESDDVENTIWIDAVCIYSNRTHMPQVSKGFDFVWGRNKVILRAFTLPRS
ncbi:hypothetical protein CLAIMM_12969 [Cladophialophora immunda]|nr:hypothetical protein CLAIMM_12969 [Cladophialophora immunda]